MIGSIWLGGSANSLPSSLPGSISCLPAESPSLSSRPSSSSRPSLMRLGEAFEALPPFLPAFLVPCCHKRALHNPLLLRRSAQLHLLSVITFPNLSSSLPLSFSCNQQEGEHNTTRTYYYCQRKITDPIPRWSVRGRDGETERETNANARFACRPRSEMGS